MKNRNYEKRIEKLQKRYSETNIAKDEELPLETRRRIKKNYNRNLQRRRVDGVLNYVKNKDSIKEEVHKIIEELPSLKMLCNNCSEEVIISVICLYVLKSRNPRYHVERTALWNRFELNWQKYSLIISRILQETRKQRTMEFREEVYETNGLLRR